MKRVFVILGVAAAIVTGSLVTATSAVAATCIQSTAGCVIQVSANGDGMPYNGPSMTFN